MAVAVAVAVAVSVDVAVAVGVVAGPALPDDTPTILSASISRPAVE